MMEICKCLKVGDVRHADEKPMDNVLFVCKMNEVTTDDDLVRHYIIYSLIYHMISKLIVAGDYFFSLRKD